MEEKKLIDDCFYVEQKKWGTFNSADIEVEAKTGAIRKHIVTGKQIGRAHV